MLGPMGPGRALTGPVVTVHEHNKTESSIYIYIVCDFFASAFQNFLSSMQLVLSAYVAASTSS